MKKTFVLSAFVLTSVIILRSEMPAPPVDSAGAPPSNATCTKAGCHAGTTVEDDNMFTLRLAANEVDLINFASIVNDSSNTLYTPGQTYFGSLELSNGASVYGFQMIALNASNAQAGAYEVTDAIHTQITNAGSRQYIGHKDASSNKVFNFKWTAPSTSQNVTFYFASVFGNGNGMNTGDEIYNGKVAVSSEVSRIEEISAVSSLNVYPTQTMSTVAVKLNAMVAQPAEIKLVDMTGKVVKILHNGDLQTGENEFLFHIAEVPQGNYLLSVLAGNENSTKHIMKL